VGSPQTGSQAYLILTQPKCTCQLLCATQADAEPAPPTWAALCLGALVVLHKFEAAISVRLCRHL